MAEKPAESPRRKWIEPVVAVLMALTTCCTAWCSYQSAAWTRRSNRLLNEYNALERRAALLDSAGQPGADRSRLDVHAAPRGAARRQRRSSRSFYAERFPPDVKKAYEAWLAQKPFENRAADAHPFVPNLYQVRGAAEAAAARADAMQQLTDGARMRVIAPVNISPTPCSLPPSSSLPARPGNSNSHACGFPPRSSRWRCSPLPSSECSSCPQPNEPHSHPSTARRTDFAGAARLLAGPRRAVVSALAADASGRGHAGSAAPPHRRPGAGGLAAAAGVVGRGRERLGAGVSVCLFSTTSTSMRACCSRCRS